MKTTLAFLTLVVTLAAGCNREEPKKLPLGYGMASYAQVVPTPERALVLAPTPTPVPPTPVPQPTAAPVPTATPAPAVQVQVAAAPTATVPADSQPASTNGVPVEVQKAAIRARLKVIEPEIIYGSRGVKEITEDWKRILASATIAQECRICSGKGYWINRESGKPVKEKCNGCNGTGKSYPDKSGVEYRARLKKEEADKLAERVDACKKEKAELEELLKSL